MKKQNEDCKYSETCEMFDGGLCLYCCLYDFYVPHKILVDDKYD